ncbi:MAG: hypothetical protein IPH89_12570 [Bacteroidetes bacterium]|nr:hypothetical protein [Bacteroidota bacterium]
MGIYKKIVNKLNIFLIFFKDIKTGEITINNVYFFFMSFCGFVQRNIYFIKGAFIIGYKQKGIVFGLKKVCEYFFYKYKKNKNIIIKKIRSVLKKLINMKLS